MSDKENENGNARPDDSPDNPPVDIVPEEYDEAIKQYEGIAGTARTGGLGTTTGGMGSVVSLDSERSTKDNESIVGRVSLYLVSSIIMISSVLMMFQSYMELEIFVTTTFLQDVRYLYILGIVFAFSFCAGLSLWLSVWYSHD